MLAPCPRLPDFCLSPSSLLSTTMHHCALLDKCNLCDNKILPNIRNVNKHRMKYPFKQSLLSQIVRFMSFSVLPCPVSSGLHTLQWYAVFVQCNLCHNTLTNVTKLKKRREKYRHKKTVQQHSHASDRFMYCTLRCHPIKLRLDEWSHKEPIQNLIHVPG